MNLFLGNAVEIQSPFVSPVGSKLAQMSPGGQVSWAVHWVGPELLGDQFDIITDDIAALQDSLIGSSK